jgi:hypothetical protein
MKSVGKHWDASNSKCAVELSLVVLALNKVFFFRILSASEWDNEDKRTLGSEMGQ